MCPLRDLFSWAHFSRASSSEFVFEITVIVPRPAPFSHLAMGQLHNYFTKKQQAVFVNFQWHFALCVHLAMFSDKLCGFRALKGFFVRPCAYLNAFLGLPCGAICRPFGSVCLLLVKAVG